MCCWWPILYDVFTLHFGFGICQTSAWCVFHFSQANSQWLTFDYPDAKCKINLISHIKLKNLITKLNIVGCYCKQLFFVCALNCNFITRTRNDTSGRPSDFFRADAKYPQLDIVRCQSTKLKIGLSFMKIRRKKSFSRPFKKRFVRQLVHISNYFLPLPLLSTSRVDIC